MLISKPIGPDGLSATVTVLKEVVSEIAAPLEN